MATGSMVVLHPTLPEYNGFPHYSNGSCSLYHALPDRNHDDHDYGEWCVGVTNGAIEKFSRDPLAPSDKEYSSLLIDSQYNAPYDPSQLGPLGHLHGHRPHRSRTAVMHAGGLYTNSHRLFELRISTYIHVVIVAVILICAIQNRFTPGAGPTRRPRPRGRPPRRPQPESNRVGLKNSTTPRLPSRADAAAHSARSSSSSSLSSSTFTGCTAT